MFAIWFPEWGKNSAQSHRGSDSSEYKEHTFWGKKRSIRTQRYAAVSCSEKAIHDPSITLSNPRSGREAVELGRFLDGFQLSMDEEAVLCCCGSW